MAAARIEFRCWFCNRRHYAPLDQIGQKRTCNCNHLLRVPKRDNGSCRCRTATDWLVEALVYGGGGALFGFCLAIFIPIPVPFRGGRLLRFVGLTVLGFLFGMFGGEPAINWMGGMLRDRENDR